MPDPDVTAALRYTGDGAPKVVAAGRGTSPRRFSRAHVRRACRFTATPSWPRRSRNWRSEQEIPEQMWTAVAQVLAWAYGLSENRPTANRR